MKTFSYIVLGLVFCVSFMFSQQNAMQRQSEEQSYNQNEAAMMVAEKLQGLTDEEQEQIVQQLSTLITMVKQMKKNGDSQHDIIEFLKNVLPRNGTKKTITSSGYLTFRNGAIAISLILLSGFLFFGYSYLKSRNRKKELGFERPDYRNNANRACKACHGDPGPRGCNVCGGRQG